jgi:signal transduction histidine kinase
MTSRHYNKSLLLGFLMVFLVLGVNAVLTYLNLNRMHRNSQLVKHQNEVVADLQKLLKLLVDAETGQRGYLITGEAKFLKPYQDSSLALQEQLKVVGKHLQGNQESKELYQQLSGAVGERMKLIARSIELHDKEGAAASRGHISMGQGKLVMDRVRELIDQLTGKELALLKYRERETQISFWTAMVTGFISAGIGFGLVIASYILIGRDLEKRQQLSDALQKSKERLEDRVKARTMEIESSNKALREEVAVRTKAELAAMQAAQELQRSNRELEQFASVASHDLQEPLRKIQAFGDRLSTLCNGQLGERGNDYLQRILASAARMRKLIDDLLTYSRVASKAQPFTAVDLNEIAEEVASDLEGRVQDVNGVIEIDKLPHLEADPTQMRQLFQNLIGNALKFHKPGVPPIVRVSAQTVSSPERSNGEPAKESGALCEITIADNGIGFEQVYVDRIFELFQRLHGRDEYQGTGMGLAICRKIVERHSGVITAHSTPGEGSRFTFTLPIHQRASNPAVTVTQQEQRA